MIILDRSLLKHRFNIFNYQLKAEKLLLVDNKGNFLYNEPKSTQNHNCCIHAYF